MTARWRQYETASGRKPVAEFIRTLTADEAAVVVNRMRDVTTLGMDAARHLVDDIYEVRAIAGDRSFRVLFSREGRRHTILLAVHAFTKKTQTTPKGEIRLAQQRLADWRRRGQGR